MQKSIQNNYAFIDSQNVNLSVRYQGWKINWSKFRVYLKEKMHVDAELVLRAMAEKENFDQAVIVSGDGDFYCLAVYLAEHNKLCKLLIPNKNRFSALLKYKILQKYLQYMNDLQEKTS